MEKVKLEQEVRYFRNHQRNYYKYNYRFDQQPTGKSTAARLYLDMENAEARSNYWEPTFRKAWKKAVRVYKGYDGEVDSTMLEFADGSLLWFRADEAADPLVPQAYASKKAFNKKYEKWDDARFDNWFTQVEKV